MNLKPTSKQMTFVIVAFWGKTEYSDKKAQAHSVFPYRSGPEVIKLFSCSTQLSTKFQLLIKTKIPTKKEVSCFKSLRCCIFYHAKNVKMPTIVGILTLMSRINFVLS